MNLITLLNYIKEISKMFDMSPISKQPTTRKFLFKMTSLFLIERLNYHINYLFRGPREILSRTTRSRGIITYFPWGIGERKKVRDLGK